MPPVILLFAKAPSPGRVKTRLQPVLSPEQCSEIHSSFVGDVLESLKGFTDIADVELHLDQETNAWAEFSYPRKLQTGADLGEKMWNAAQNAFEQGRSQVMILGSDSPTLPPGHLQAILSCEADITFGPSIDGGYYAVQFRKLPPNLFDGIEWSTDQALDQSIKAAEKFGLSVARGLTWYDIDSPADLVRLVTEEPPRRTKAWLKANHFLVDPPVGNI
jgi:rSAM/selenodomain-associated transferase 1